ncbi:MAG: OmpW/AlkL family protein, partial [Methylocella sp.]
AGAVRLCAAAMVGCLAAIPVAAEDLVTQAGQLPPQPPVFYVHAGALGAFPQVNAQPTGGGLFPAANMAIRPQYTLAVEVGYFVTPNIALAVGAGVPPIAHIKATGLPTASAFGSNLIGSVRYGAAVALLQYHFTQFGAVQPYAGAGAGYVLNLGNISDGILTNFTWDQNFAFVLQGGADWMLTENWGVFVDGKKLFYSTDAQGFSGAVPFRAHVQLDPWVASAGITFKY